jgi:phosphoenolpyruvate phosphomutase
MSKAVRLRELFRETSLVTLIGAHNPLSARLAQQAGFAGIWASGFELSAAYGVPDASLISMTQHLEMARLINDAVSIPVVADIDTGYGNAINVIYTIEKYEAAGMAAIVIEDKKFPKDTSLLAGGRQELLSIEEFEGKIQAAVAARTNSDLMIIARVEALIAGQGQAEAKRRGERYADAGADAILIHSKSKTPDEITDFVSAWEHDTPLVLVPTAYPQLTEEAIKALGKVKMVIYGNHGIRAAVTAMEQAFRQIRADGGIHNVDKTIVSVEHIFELQGVAQMKQNEKKFLR